MKLPVRAHEPAFGSDFSRGMEVREYIATQCLAALAGSDNHNPAQAAEKALAYADALLQLLAGSNGDKAKKPADDELIDLDAAGTVD